MQKIQHYRGYVLLTSVLILGAIGLTIGVTVALLGTDATRTQHVSRDASEAKYIAEACVERALQSIRSDGAFTGVSNYSMGEGSCDVTVADTGGDTRSIESIGASGNITYRIDAHITEINPFILVGDWDDVESF